MCGTYRTLTIGSASMIVAHLVGTNDNWLIYLGVAIVALGAARLAGLGARRIPEKAGVIAIVVGLGVVLLESLIPGVVNAPRPPAAATLSIAAPADGQRLTTPDIRVDVVAPGFVFEPVAATPRPARSGHGHLHVLVDGKIVAMPPKPDAAEVCIPDGRHMIQAELVAEDHQPFRDQATVTKAVTVDGAAGATCP